MSNEMERTKEVIKSATEIKGSVAKSLEVIQEEKRKEAVRQTKIDNILESIKRATGKEMSIEEAKAFVEEELPKIERLQVRAQKLYDKVSEKLSTAESA